MANEEEKIMADATRQELEHWGISRRRSESGEAFLTEGQTGHVEFGLAMGAIIGKPANQ
jgi:hypothetical protein